MPMWKRPQSEEVLWLKYNLLFQINIVIITNFKNKKTIATMKNQINEQKARQLYKELPSMKQGLEEIFGKAFFDADIFERVKSYEDACTELGIEPINEAELKRQGVPDDEIAYRMIKTITKALNAGWEADWTDDDEKKWVPYFNVSPSGFVFDVSDYYYSLALAGDAVRLCFKDEKTSSYAGRTFTDLYRRFIL